MRFGGGEELRRRGGGRGRTIEIRIRGYVAVVAVSKVGVLVCRHGYIGGTLPQVV